ncbi:Aste57867_18480 [Aphanomyces stellatus]|uniref:Aste57867_18480 protein n=1 Tax=Aphanomyces stellatus TaxID=120398 RepID=A0A485LA74_9STRA|nr:hypothetical protein As57867_018418 [Aphanomyces stellatus]VFT95216.1 Aste57867_18480 [Aphanomyces stellatus]
METLVTSAATFTLSDDDLWTIDTLLGGPSLDDMNEIAKDLDFLAATPPPVLPISISHNHLTIDTSPDAVMNHVFATEVCFSPESRPKHRHSLESQTLEPMPPTQPAKRKSLLHVQLPPYPLQPKPMMSHNPLSPTSSVASSGPFSPTSSCGGLGSPKSPKKCKQCVAPGCTRRAQSNNRCKSHGGGARCTVPDCGKSSQGGGLCRAHGGGKKCKYPGCTKGTQRLGLCYLHGGIRRCTFPGCVKKDRGNGFCIGHGGGKKIVKDVTTIKKEPTMTTMPLMGSGGFMGRAIAMP